MLFILSRLLRQEISATLHNSQCHQTLSSGEGLASETTDSQEGTIRTRHGPRKHRRLPSELLLKAKATAAVNSSFEAITKYLLYMRALALELAI